MLGKITRGQDKAAYAAWRHLHAHTAGERGKRYALELIYVRDGTGYATDGHRAAIAPLPGVADGEYMLASSTLKHVIPFQHVEDGELPPMPDYDNVTVPIDGDDVRAWSLAGHVGVVDGRQAERAAYLVSGLREATNRQLNPRYVGPVLDASLHFVRGKGLKADAPLHFWNTDGLQTIVMPVTTYAIEPVPAEKIAGLAPDTVPATAE